MVFENLAVEVFLYTQASSPVNNRHKKKFTHQIEKEKHWEKNMKSKQTSNKKSYQNMDQDPKHWPD